MIRQPGEILTKEKRIRILLAGFPGIGKSTLALSAPKPLHIDIDHGIDRIDARYRKPFIQPETYQELKDDLQEGNQLLDDFETLVFDTGGQLIKLMGPWVIKQNSKNGQSDGTLSLKGYGAVGREFENLMNHCYYTLHKNIVVVFHAKEKEEGDVMKLRLMVEGQTKDNVWQPMDLGGFIEIQGQHRTLGLSNCERYFAKGTHGINGIRRLPELAEGTPNDYLIKLFKQVNVNIAAETEVVEQERESYDLVMADAAKLIQTIKKPKDAQKVSDQIQEMNHALTSEKEIRTMLLRKLNELGIVYDKGKGEFVCKPGDAA